MRLKKLISVGIAVIMTASVFAGCGKTESKNESNSSTSTSQKTQEQQSVVDTSQTSTDTKEIVFPLEETMEFTGFSMKANNHYYADNIAWKAALERGNIDIKLTEVMRADVADKGKLLLNSGDYPDMLFKPGFALDKYGMDGVLIPLEDLIKEYAPNLSALLDEREAWDDIAAPDGHIYSLPYVDWLCNVTMGVSGPIWINQRWLDNLGLKAPTNMEELYDVLKAFKEKDANGNGDPNDEVALTFSGGQNNMIHMLSLLMEDVLMYSNYCAIVDNEFVFYPMTDGFKDFLAYFAKMYEEGILDNNSVTQTSAQYKAFGKTGDFVGMFQGSSPDALVLEEYAMDYVTLESYNLGGYPLGTGVAKNGLAITDKCENPEVLVAWADYFYSEEGGKLVRLGIEGESYTVNADGTYTVNLDKFEDWDYQATFMGAANVPGLSPEFYYTQVSSVESPLMAYTNDQLVNHMKGTVLPQLVYTEEEEENRKILVTDFNAYIKSYFAEVVTGQLNVNDSWEKFQSTLKDMGADKLVGIYQAAYERATAN